MCHNADYSAFDRPEVLGITFHPRNDWSPPPATARDYMIPVSREVSVSARFYPTGPGTTPGTPACGMTPRTPGHETAPPGDRTAAATRNGAPCILFFHGNGEVACDYDPVAPVYNRLGINLFVADYRGYGRSGGTPAFSSMVRDAHAVAGFFLETMQLQEQSGPLFIMGRSLGAVSALEIAFHYAVNFSGIIVESGSANFLRVLSHHGLALDPGRTAQVTTALPGELALISMPALIIHGDQDTLVPPEEACRLYSGIGSMTKRLVIIAGAGHNDIMVSGAREYFTAVREFVENSLSLDGRRSG